MPNLQAGKASRKMIASPEQIKPIIQGLGKRLSSQEVAMRISLDVKTVKKYYVELGGSRFGRLYVFFENLVDEAIRKGVFYALQKRHEMGGVCQEELCETRDDLREQDRGGELGERSKKTPLGEVLKQDRHGIFNSGMGQ